MAPLTHIHISEREVAHTWPDGQHDDAAWEDCTWCAAVMLARAAHDPSIPATHAEAEALRAASGEGPLGGSNTYDVLRGYARRYGWVPINVGHSASDVVNSLLPARVALVSGSMGAFPDGHRLRRFDPKFGGAHAIFAARMDDSDRVWWDDPLAPTGAYRGEWVTMGELSSFVMALGGGRSLIARQYEETSVAIKPITSEVPATMDVVAGSVMYLLDGVTKCGSTATSLVGRFSPYEAKPLRSMYATIGGTRRVVLVQPVTGSVKPVQDRTPFSQDDIDAAKASARLEGVEQEKSRIRSELGL